MHTRTISTNVTPQRKTTDQPQEMYDLTLDRRAHCRRHETATIKFERRHDDRRHDLRPLNEFPYVPLPL